MQEINQRPQGSPLLMSMRWFRGPWARPYFLQGGLQTALLSKPVNYFFHRITQDWASRIPMTWWLCVMLMAIGHRMSSELWDTNSVLLTLWLDHMCWLLRWNHVLDLIYLSSDHRAAVVEDGNKCIFFFCCCRGFFFGGGDDRYIFSCVPTTTDTHTSLPLHRLCALCKGILWGCTLNSFRGFWDYFSTKPKGSSDERPLLPPIDVMGITLSQVRNSYSLLK